MAFDEAVSAYFRTERGHAWGETQLRACDAALAGAPDFAAARFAAAMVFTARSSFDRALAAASAGATAQSRHAAHETSPFPSIGLHWLRGLLLLRERQIGLAIESFVREMDELGDTAPYACEFRVHAQVAAGFAHLAARDISGAVDTFRVALETVPRSGRALIGLYTAFQQTSLAREAKALLTQIDQTVAELAGDQRGEAEIIIAASQAARGDIAGACTTLTQLLEDAPAGHAGWQIPIDPALAPLRSHVQFPRVLTLLAARAA